MALIQPRDAATASVLFFDAVNLLPVAAANILLTISGSIYIESLYSIPGMGNLLLSAISRQDNPLVQALVLIYSSLGIFGLLLGDLLMVLCDPRIKLVRGNEALT